MTKTQWIVVAVLTLAFFGFEYYKANNPALEKVFCIGGVSYLQFSTGVSVEYTAEGKVRTC